MNIKALTIYGYGKWLDQEIPIKAPLQVIYGPNEAGKSTLIDFIESMLFGFQTKNQAVHGQYHPKRSQAYGGELLFSANGNDYKLIRTEGKNGGDVDFFDVSAHQHLLETDFQKLISPIDRTAYRQLFYFGDFDEKAFYRTDEAELGLRIQQIGVTDADQWAQLQKALAKTADKLYKPRGRTKTINVKLKQYRKLEEAVQQAKEAYPRYLSLTSKVADLTTQIADERTKLTAKQKQARQNHQVAQYLPLIKEQQELAHVNDQQVKPGFSEPDRQMLENFNLQIQSLTGQIAENQAKKKAASEAMTTNPAQVFYEAHRQQIDELAQQIPEQRNIAAQIHYLTDQQRQTQHQINQLVTTIPKNHDGQLPSPFAEDEVVTINEWLNQEAVLQEQMTQHQRTRQERGKAAASKTPAIIYYGIAGLVALMSGFLFSGGVRWLGYLVSAGLLIWALQPQINHKPTPTVDQPATSPNLTNQLDQVQESLRQVQTRYRLEGIAEAQWLAIQPQLRQLTALKQSLATIDAQLQEKQGRYEQFFDHWRFAQDWLRFDNQNAMNNLSLLEQTISRWREQSADKLSKQNSLAIYQKMIDQATLKRQQITQKKQSFFKERAIATDNDFYTQLKDQARIRADLKRQKELAEQIQAAQVTIPKTVDQAQLQATIQQTDQQIDQLQQTINTLSEQRAGLNVKVDQLVKSGDYYNLRQQLANLETDILSDVHRYLALQLATRWIRNVLNIATRGRVPKILNLAKRYFSILTLGRYKDILFKDDISVVRKDDMVFALNELSKGTLEQLYLSLIFSMTVGFSDQYPLPIIIDDGFVNFDKQRKQAAFETLKEISKQTQVLYFTANLDSGLDQFDVLDLNQL